MKCIKQNLLGRLKTTIFAITACISSVVFADAYYNIGFMVPRVPYLKITTSAQSIKVGNCSGVVTVQTNTGSRAVYSVPSNLTVNLTGPGTTTFYSDFNCSVSTTSITVNSGSSSTSFYFISTATTTQTLTAAATGYTSVSQNETLATNPYVWTGLGANANWTTGANWSGGSAPGFGSNVLFDGTCTNCNSTMASSEFSMIIRMTSAYTGITTIAAAASSSGSITLLGGTIDASASASVDTSQYPVVILGTAVFKAPTGTGIWHANQITVASSSNIVPGTGTVSMENWNAGIFSSNPVNLNSLQLGSTAGSQLGTISGTVNVLGDLILNSTYLSWWVGAGTLNVAGNITVTAWTDNGSTLNVVWNGSGSKNYSVASSTVYLPFNFTMNGTGTLTMTSATVAFMYGFTYTAGTLVPATTTVFLCASWGSTYTISPGTLTYNSVSFGDGTNTESGATSCILSGTLTVGGNLSFNTYSSATGKIAGGTINVAGNINDTTWTDGGSSVNVTMNGSAAQTLTQGASAKFPKGTLTFNNSTTSVALGSNFVFSSTGNNTSVTTHGVSMSGFNMTLKALTLSAGTTVSLGGGTLIVNGVTKTAGAFSGGTITP